MADSRNKPELETLSYKPRRDKSGKVDHPYSYLSKPETRANKAEDAEQILEPIEFPEMDENTKLIINACKQVIQSADDYDNDVMTTPITVVQACEQLNCVLEVIKANKPEQPNQNLMIIEEIGGLMSQVNEKLDILSRNTFMLCQQPMLISVALKEIDLFQKTTLFDLRKAFE